MRCLCIIALCLLCTCQSCKKNIQYDLKPILNTADDNILSQRPFNYAFFMLLKACTDSSLMRLHQTFIDGAVVYLSTSGKTITFIFDGGFSQDSVIRYGSFKAVMDTNFFLKGAKTRFSFQGYIEDNHHVEGKCEIENSGINEEGMVVFKSLADSAIITKDSIHDIHWEGKMDYLISPAGIFTDPGKLLVIISGEGSGISSLGYAFQSVIISPLKDSLNCPWIHDGTISISIAEGDIRSGTIEYMGKTMCSDRIDYDFEGRQYHIWIREKYLRN